MFSEVFPLNVVRNNSLQLYQVELTKWGDTTLAPSENSIVSPIFDFSLAGLAIDPESTVTSVIVRPVTAKGGLDDSGTSKPADFIVDKEHPFIGRLTFPRIPPYNGKWGLVAYNGDRYGDTATAEDGQALNPFGGALGAAFTRPTLKLIMSVDALPPSSMVPRRTPYRRQLQVTTNVLGPTRVAIEPMSGRRLIRVTAAPLIIPGVTTCIFRGLTPGPGIGVTEFSGLAPDVVVDAPAVPGAVKTVLIENPAAHYLEVLLRSDVAGPVTSVRLTIDMFD